MKVFQIIVLMGLLLSGVCNVYAEDYKIVIKTQHNKMVLMKDSKVIKEFKVSTVKAGLPVPKNVGVVTKVELEPNWYPTQRTKDYFKEHKGIILPQVVPYGSPHNYMGAFKISMTNSTPSRGQIYRIHGTLNESTIGTNETGGCVRMYNKEGKEFAKHIKELIKSNTVKVIYET